MPGKETELVVDASKTGLGAILLQKPSKNQPFHVVAYKSRALKDVETRYSTTEREALAIRWGVKKMRHLLLGAPRFTIVSDHKPLGPMFNKVTGDVPPRIERFIMDLQEFDHHVEHRPGKDCIADFLSRSHSRRQGTSPTETLEKNVFRIVAAETCHAIKGEGAVSMEDVRRATDSCPLSKRILQMMESGSGSQDPDLEPYNRIRHQLSVIQGVICKGQKVFVPPSLQKRVVKLCHKAHQGMAKAKAFARSFCWFSGIDEAIERKVKTCLQCQAVQEGPGEQPIKPNELPSGPWQQVEMDFQGPYPAGEYIFVMIDRYTRWPEAKIMGKAPTAGMTMKAMR